MGGGWARARENDGIEFKSAKEFELRRGAARASAERGDVGKAKAPVASRVESRSPSAANAATGTSPAPAALAAAAAAAAASLWRPSSVTTVRRSPPACGGGWASLVIRKGLIA